MDSMLLDEHNARLNQYHREAAVTRSTESSRSPPSVLQSSSLPTHPPSPAAAPSLLSPPAENAQITEQAQWYSQLP